MHEHKTKELVSLLMTYVIHPPTAYPVLLHNCGIFDDCTRGKRGICRRSKVPRCTGSSRKTLRVVFAWSLSSESLTIVSEETNVPMVNGSGRMLSARLTFRYSDHLT
jgi:hypothetical protein